jgi:hypothetical protein
LSTPFLNIYKQNEVFKNDSRLKYKPTNQLYELYSTYLDFAIGEFDIDCYKDLDNILPFTQNEYYYNADGVNNVFSVSTLPDNCLFYVGTAPDSNTCYTETTNYTFDNIAMTITINNAILPQGTFVYISGYQIGEFSDDLNKMEINILNAGMLVPWDMEHIHRDSLLTQMMVNGNSKIYSQAQHISSVADVANNQYFKVFQSMITSYSYKYSPNSLRNLGGRGY